MKRTTKYDLASAVRVLNQLVGATPGHPGAYCLQGAYGGWQLQRVLVSGTDAIFPGYRSKRELLELIHAFRAGVRVGQQTPAPATD
jgi:hypothetical protein